MASKTAIVGSAGLVVMPAAVMPDASVVWQPKKALRQSSRDCSPFAIGDLEQEPAAASPTPGVSVWQSSNDGYMMALQQKTVIHTQFVLSAARSAR